MRKKRKCNEAQIELEMKNEITEAKNRNKKEGLKDYISHKKRSMKSKLRASWAPAEHVALREKGWSGSGFGARGVISTGPTAQSASVQCERVGSSLKYFNKLINTPSVTY